MATKRGKKTVVLNPPKEDGFKLDPEVLKKALERLRAINHPLRSQILEFLSEQEEKGRKKVCVTDIFISLGLEQSIASQHIGILKRAGFLLAKHDGKRILYRIDYDVLEKTIKRVSFFNSFKKAKN